MWINFLVSKTTVQPKSKASKQKANWPLVNLSFIFLIYKSFVCASWYDFMQFHLYMIFIRFRRISNDFPICFCHTRQAQFAVEASSSRTCCAEPVIVRQFVGTVTVLLLWSAFSAKSIKVSMGKLRCILSNYDGHVLLFLRLGSSFKWLHLSQWPVSTQHTAIRARFLRPNTQAALMESLYWLSN